MLWGKEVSLLGSALKEGLRFCCGLASFCFPFPLSFLEDAGGGGPTTDSSISPSSNSGLSAPHTGRYHQTLMCSFPSPIASLGLAHPKAANSLFANSINAFPILASTSILGGDPRGCDPNDMAHFRTKMGVLNFLGINSITRVLIGSGSGDPLGKTNTPCLP